MKIRTQFHHAVLVCVLIVVADSLAHAQYSGGTGDPNDPYKIASVQDLIDLGQTPDDYGKHFVLTTDIDLSDIVFDRALIAPDMDDVWGEYQGVYFSGSFDGQGHVIRHLRVDGTAHLGLFGYTTSEAIIANLGLEMVDINGVSCVGAVVGYNGGSISSSYSTGTIQGRTWYAGGLVGYHSNGDITSCYSMAAVTGASCVGGLVGYMRTGKISSCYSTGKVVGSVWVGPLVGNNFEGSVINSFWDTETSGPSCGDDGVGLTTVEMMDAQMLGLNGLANDPDWVLDPGKDYPRLAWEGTPGQMISAPPIDWMEGEGTSEAPYRIASVEQFIRVTRAGALADRHFVLVNDLDLSGRVWPRAVIPYFSGAFDGGGFKIRDLHVRARQRAGLFGHLAEDALITSLGLEAVDVNGVEYSIGSLVGYNDGGAILSSYSTGVVSGKDQVGGLVGHMERGRIISSHSSCAVNGRDSVGGLLGWNRANVSQCHSTGKVTASQCLGGLVGYNCQDVSMSYSTGTVRGGSFAGGLVGFNIANVSTSFSRGMIFAEDDAGGLVGFNSNDGDIASSYSQAVVYGDDFVGGLVGSSRKGHIASCYCSSAVFSFQRDGGLVAEADRNNVLACFWTVTDPQRTYSSGGTGLAASEMQKASTYLTAGWDFVDETTNGSEDIWWIDEGQDYPRLWWERLIEDSGDSASDDTLYPR